jgi:hypothetical protein
VATTAKGAHSNAEHVFEGLFHDSAIEVFNATLGKIAGQALLEAVKKHAPLQTDDPLKRPDLLDQMLIAHLGSVAQVLERRILKTLASKTATAAALRENGHIDFGSEVKKIREQFLKRKQAGDRPHPSE